MKSILDESTKESFSRDECGRICFECRPPPLGDKRAHRNPSIYLYDGTQIFRAAFVTVCRSVSRLTRLHKTNQDNQVAVERFACTEWHVGHTSHLRYQRHGNLSRNVCLGVMTPRDGLTQSRVNFHHVCMCQCV